MAQDTISLSLDPRTVTGKAVKHLRKAGKVPAVIHDHGRPSIIVEGDSLAILKVYHQAGKHHPIVITTDGKTYTTLIKNAEFEPRKNKLSHVVFNAVSANQVVEAEVPVEPKYAEGNEATPAERGGLIVLNNLDVVEVEAVPSMLPDVIYYDAEKLVKIGDQITVADLIVPPKVNITSDPGQAVATVYEPSALAAANDAAGGAAEEPEESETVSEDTVDEENKVESEA